MAYLRTRILADALARINAVGNALRPSGAVDATVGAGTEAPIPSMRLYVREDDAARPQGNPRASVNLRHLHIDVEHRIAGSVSVDAYQRAEPYLAWAAGALDGVILDGSVREATEVSVGWEENVEAEPYVLATQRFSVPYQQAVGDLTKQS